MDIIAQVVFATTVDEIVLASAHAHEVPSYGLKVGLTNYVVAYCTDLLLPCRVLKMLKMDVEYERNVEFVEKTVVIMAEEEANKGLDYTLKVILEKIKKRDELAFISKRRSN